MKVHVKKIDGEWTVSYNDDDLAYYVLDKDINMVAWVLDDLADVGAIELMSEYDEWSED